MGEWEGPRLWVLCLFYNLRHCCAVIPSPHSYQALPQTRDLPILPQLCRKQTFRASDSEWTHVSLPGQEALRGRTLCRQNVHYNPRAWENSHFPSVSGEPGPHLGLASDEGRTGKKVLWGMTSCGCIEACKHLMIPCHGLHHWFISNRGKLWQGNQTLTCWFYIYSKLWIWLRGHGEARRL